MSSLDPARSVAVLDDGSELPYDLFMGVPKHRAPDVVLASGMAENGYVPVDPRTLQTRYPGVYAVGDVATIGVPKAGVFAGLKKQGGGAPLRFAGLAARSVPVRDENPSLRNSSHMEVRNGYMRCRDLAWR